MYILYGLAHDYEDPTEKHAVATFDNEKDAFQYAAKSVSNADMMTNRLLFHRNSLLHSYENEDGYTEYCNDYSIEEAELPHNPIFGKE